MPDLTVDDLRNNRENLCFTWHCGNVSPRGLACEKDPGHGGQCGALGVRWDGHCARMERRARLHGHLAHFCVLSTKDMAEVFKVSPSTIRRHMRALERDGLVHFNRHWGAWEALDGDTVAMTIESA